MRSRRAWRSCSSSSRSSRPCSRTCTSSPVSSTRSDTRPFARTPTSRICTSREYLAAIRDTGYDGTVSIELEYSPDPDKIVEWAQQAYDGTAQIMGEIGVRG